MSGSGTRGFALFMTGSFGRRQIHYLWRLCKIIEG